MSTTIDRPPEVVRREIPRTSSRWGLRQVLLTCGIAASLVYVAANVAGALRWEGYSSMDQTVSELFAIDAPSRPLVVSILFASGVLALAFGIGVVWSAGQSRPLRVAGWALVGIGIVDQVGPFTPMHTREVIAAGGSTFSDTMHIVVTMVISLLTVIGMAFAAAAFGKRFKLYSVITIATLVVFGALTTMYAGELAANETTPLQGLYERIDIGAYLLWMAALAAVLLRGRSRQTTKGRAG